MHSTCTSFVLYEYFYIAESYSYFCFLINSIPLKRSRKTVREFGELVETGTCLFLRKMSRYENQSLKSALFVQTKLEINYLFLILILSPANNRVQPAYLFPVSYRTFFYLFLPRNLSLATFAPLCSPTAWFFPFQRQHRVWSKAIMHFGGVGLAESAGGSVFKLSQGSRAIGRSG